MWFSSTCSIDEEKASNLHIWLKSDVPYFHIFNPLVLDILLILYVVSIDSEIDDHC